MHNPLDREKQISHYPVESESITVALISSRRFTIKIFFGIFQNVFGQCLQEIPPSASIGYGLLNPSPCLGAGLSAGLASPGLYNLGGLAATGVGLGASLLASDSAAAAAYGGCGVGNVNVFGELPVGGSTLVSGQVPILGSVQFGGPLPAAGSVTISGGCSCGCNYGY